MDEGQNGEETFADHLAKQPASIQEAVEQLAMFQNARDGQESGTAAWEHLDPLAHESYRKDAYAIVLAIITLGWTPPADSA